MRFENWYPLGKTGPASCPGRRWRGAILAASALLGLACGSGGGDSGSPLPDADRRNGSGPVHAGSEAPVPSNIAHVQSILLVTVDTLRADRLGCYGGRSPSTPAYDRLASEGVVFDDAVATNPLTLPAHTSILTGRYPGQHGVHGNGNFAVPSSERTLASILRDAGFQTAAFVGAFPVSFRFGVGAGFRTFDDDFGTLTEVSGAKAARSARRAREVNAKALPWLDKVGQRRFFLWIHYFDTHFEYVPEEPFASRYPGAPYDGEVAATDAALAEVLAALDRLGLAASTAVVLLADHGEGLGDHGEAFHGFFLYDTTIRIPILVRAHGITRAGGRVTRPVSGADIAPTILDLLGLPIPAPMTGRSFMPDLTREEGSSAGGGAADSENDLASAVLCESYGAWFEFRWSPLIGLRSRSWKFVEAPQPELYDLRADPKELRNLAEIRPEMLASARAAVASALARNDAVARTAVVPSTQGGDSAARSASAEDIERLKSLGYAASGAAPKLPPPGGSLRDPKSMPGFEEAYYRAFALVNSGQDQAAIAAFTELTRRDPSAPVVRYQLGRELRRTKKFDAALRELTRALALAPDFAEAAFELGVMREDLADPAGAERWYRKALGINPAYPEAHAALARRRYQAGDPAGAREEMGRALALAPSDPIYREAMRSLESRMRK